MLDPQTLIDRGLFYRQRYELYKRSGYGDFGSVYADRVGFFFDKARWRCQRLIDERKGDDRIERLLWALDREDPDPPGEPVPAEFYDAVMEEWKMYTYFKEYWREDARNINID